MEKKEMYVAPLWKRKKCMWLPRWKSSRWLWKRALPEATRLLAMTAQVVSPTFNEETNWM